MSTIIPKKEKTFYESDKSFDETTLPEKIDENVTFSMFKRPFLDGLLTGLIFYLVSFVLTLLIWYLGFSWFFQNLGLFTLTLSGIFFFAGGITIWFGPSPQWAGIQSRLLRKPKKPTDTIESLKTGVKRVGSGLLLMFLSA